MKIYTRTGDAGETHLFAGPRVSKDHPRIEACGSVDELNAAIGAACAASLPAKIDELLGQIQHELFSLGAELATPDPAANRTDLIGDANVAALEAAIDQYDAELSPLEQFILPGGSPAAAAIHLARGGCRRAERCVVSLRAAEPDAVAERTVGYLNRLGDLLFVLARAANAAANVPDVVWEKPGSRSSDT